MENLSEKIRSRMENCNGFYEILSDLAGVPYNSSFYNAAAEGGFDIDLMYNIGEDSFETCIEGEGELFEMNFNMIMIGTIYAYSEQNLIRLVEEYLD